LVIKPIRRAGQWHHGGELGNVVLAAFEQDDLHLGPRAGELLVVAGDSGGEGLGRAPIAKENLPPQRVQVFELPPGFKQLGLRMVRHDVEVRRFQAEERAGPPAELGKVGAARFRDELLPLGQHPLGAGLFHEAENAAGLGMIGVLVQRRE
jgi:hypothetical protein